MNLDNLIDMYRRMAPVFKHNEAIQNFDCCLWFDELSNKATHKDLGVLVFGVSGCEGYSGGVIKLQGSSSGFNCLSTSCLWKLNSLWIKDIADLQDSSSLNARVHLPSTKVRAFAFPDAAAFEGSSDCNVGGRILKCSHLGCLSSTRGWVIETRI